MIPHTLPALSRALCRASLTLLAICASATATPYTVTGSGVIDNSSGPGYGIDGETVTFSFTYDDGTFTRTANAGNSSNYTPASPIAVELVGSISGPIAVDPITHVNAYNDPGGNFDQWNFVGGIDAQLQANSFSSQGFTSDPGADFKAVNTTFVNGLANHWEVADSVLFGKESVSPGSLVFISNATWTVVSSAPPLAPASTVVAFNGTNGYQPSAITRASDGNYYGPAYSSVFKVTPAGVFTKLGDFDYTAHGGQLEGGVVMAADGNLYGAALAGGSSGRGTLYRLTPTGTITKLVDFDGSNGSYPFGSLMLASDGAMYGLTQQGGDNNRGVVYKVTTGGTFSVVAHLSDSVGTAYTQSGLVQGPDGALYGLGYGGGTNNEGTVFKVTIAGAGSISKIADLSYSTLGGYPNCALTVGPDGALYGTTSYGGPSGSGTAIRVTTSGVVTKLADFSSETGYYPSGALVLAGDGNFYGQTSYGGPGSEGTVFRLTPAGVLSLVAYGHRTYDTPGYAQAINGSDISGLAVTEDGSLLGVAASEGPNRSGSIFRLNTFIPPSTGFFVTGSGGYIPTGFTGAFAANATLIRTESSVAATRTFTIRNRTAAPVTVTSVTKTGSSNISLNISGLPAVLAPNGTQSFTMTYQSPLPDGDVTVTVASNDPTTPSYQFQVHGRVDRLVKIAEMDPNTTGFYPRSDLLPDGAGDFYAMTSYGSIGFKGMAIKVTPTGAITPLAPIASFGGGDPYGEFIQGPGGMLYGFTASGGSGNSGTFFRMTPAGETTLIASVSGYPYGTPVLANDGNFYGLTRFGAGFNGTIIRITPAGEVTDVFAFNESTGTRPTGSLIKGNDGALYGMTSESGNSYGGTIFKFTAAGEFTKLADFENATTGSYPQEDLIQASDGNFYGICTSGGTNNEGTIFRMTPAGVLTKLADFDSSTTGKYPEGSLFEASDGNFYGLTKQGGAGGVGTVFRITPAGVLTKIADFDRASTGAEPLGSLVEGSPGLLYGTASVGGAGGYGTIFKVLINLPAPPPNQAPTDIALSASSIAENNAPGASVGTLTATDPDGSDTHTFEFAAGGVDNSAFSISGASLKLTPSADFETKSSYLIKVRATDSGGLFVEKDFTITITEVNEAPTFAGYSASTPFQKAVSMSLGKVLAKATDVEADALSVSSAGPSSTQGGTAMIQSGSIRYTPANGFSGVDTFPVTITDARGASVIGTVTVNVQINTGIGGNTPVLTSMSGGQMGIGFQGIPGRSYQVQRSTDLNNWITLSTVTAAANGAVTFIDVSPPPGSAFYRLRRP